MRRILFTAVLLLLAPAVRAQVTVNVQVVAPTIRFAVRPPVVLVAPGIEVVPDHDDEVFFVAGAYWSRRDGRWFRAHDHHGGWTVVAARRVPRGLVELPPGKYKHFKGKGHGKHKGKGKGHGRH